MPMNGVFAPHVWFYNQKNNTEEANHLVVATLMLRVLYDCKAIANQTSL